LYQHVHREALKSDSRLQPYNICQPAFTAQLLAHYLYSKCSSVLTTKGIEVKMYRHLMQTESPLLSDVILFKTVEKQLQERVEAPVGHDRTHDGGDSGSRSMDTSLLVTLLELVALEKLIRVRQVMVLKLHSPNYPLVNEFKALYAYKCGLFEECMRLCRDYIFTLLPAGRVLMQCYEVSFPEMLYLLDGELVSLFGIIQLSRPDSFVYVFHHRPITMLTLLLYLLTRCQRNLCSDSLSDTMNLIRYVHDEVIPADEKIYYLDRLILKLTYRSLKLYINAHADTQSR